VVDGGFAGLVVGGVGWAGVAWGVAQWNALTVYFPALMDRQRGRPDAYRWAREHLPPDAVVVAHQESRFALHTGRHAIGMPLPSRLGYAGDRKRIAAYFDTVGEVACRHGARYLYSTPFDFEFDLGESERRAWRAGVESGGRWRLLHAENGVSIHEGVGGCDKLF
jgi:hypothetical protein